MCSPLSRTNSNLVAFYYGNLTHPSVDPPRIGFLSIVPANASSIVQSIVSQAQANSGHFESTLLFPIAGLVTRRHLSIAQALPRLPRRMWRLTSYWKLPVSSSLQLRPLPLPLLRDRTFQVHRQHPGARPT